MALIDNLVYYYKLDEASGSRVDSHGTNDLTDVNTVVGATGKINNGASFDGVDERLDFGTFFTPSGDRSVSFWVNFTSTVDGVCIGSDSPSYYPYIDGTNIYIRDTGGVSSIAHGGMSAGTWYHIVITGNGTTATAYVNGSSLGTMTDRSPEFQSVGSFNDSVSSNVEGIIDELGYWNRIITGTEVTQLYNSGNGKPYSEFGEAPPTNLVPGRKYLGWMPAA